MIFKATAADAFFAARLVTAIAVFKVFVLITFHMSHQTVLKLDLIHEGHFNDRIIVTAELSVEKRFKG